MVRYTWMVLITAGLYFFNPPHLHLNMKAYILLLLTLLLISCRSGNPTERDDPENTTLHVFTAAGMRLASEEICAGYSLHTGTEIEHNFASSGLLARQILNGARADVFISASIDWITYLTDMGLIAEGGVSKIAGNRLVAVCARDKTPRVPEFSPAFNPLEGLEGVIAVGDPAYVPVGTYTKMVFDSLKWTAGLHGRAIFCKDVASTLHYAESGACDWAVVYRSEALQSEKVRILSEIPEGLHRSVEFYIAVCKGRPGEGLRKCFLETSSREIMEKYGFTATGS